VSAKLSRVFQLRFTTLVEAPLTVAFDVARSLGRPWPHPLREVVSERPWRDVYEAAPGNGWRTLVHTRQFSATGAGTLVHEQVDWDTALPGVLGGLVDQTVLRRRIVRGMQAYLDAYSAAAARRALDVTQVVGAALVDDRRRVLVAQRGSGPLAGLWEFPGGKVEPGETPQQALVRELREELQIEATVGSELARYEHEYPSGSRVHLLFFAIPAYTGQLKGLVFEQIQWTDIHRLPSLDFLDGDFDFVRRLARGDFRSVLR
jgi:8-oxo-dGTP diphosphatase